MSEPWAMVTMWPRSRAEWHVLASQRAGTFKWHASTPATKDVRVGLAPESGTLVITECRSCPEEGHMYAIEQQEDLWGDHDTAVRVLCHRAAEHNREHIETRSSLGPRPGDEYGTETMF